MVTKQNLSGNAEMCTQITCLYDMDIPRPDNFNETYLYEGIMLTAFQHCEDANTT